MKSIWHQFRDGDISSTEYHNLWAISKGYKNWNDYNNKCNHVAKRHKKRGTLKERFWSKVNKREEHECWEWMGTVIVRAKGKGYGHFHLGGSKKVSAHRMCYMLSIGRIPEGLFVLHTCYNPSCVNPKHLFLGTHKENMDDMVNKGRKGSSLDNVDNDLIIKAHKLFSCGNKKTEISKKLGLTMSLVNKMFDVDLISLYK